MLGPLFCTAGHRVRTQLCDTASAGQRRCCVEIRVWTPLALNSIYVNIQLHTPVISTQPCALHTLYFDVPRTLMTMLARGR